MANENRGYLIPVAEDQGQLQAPNDCIYSPTTPHHAGQDHASQVAIRFPDLAVVLDTSR
jgi:hypothetical protein